MKIGVVTIMDNTNYGNRLQNYAMCKTLQKFFDCEVVTVVSEEGRPFCNGNYIAWIKEKISQGLCCFPTIAEKRFGTNVTRWTNFEKWNRRVPIRIYYGHQQLPDIINKEFDYFVAGSDQIWNYHFASTRFYDYFLKFADDNKKISLSASFGVEDIPEEWEQEYKTSLEMFKHISVREYAGQQVISDLLEKKVPVLIDPTMMLSGEDWLAVSEPPRVDCSKPYILKYYLGGEEENQIDIWAQENEYEVYELLNDEIPELYSAGPGEFISLISNAALVCSDSFHCIVFSIIFSKPFIVYERQGSENYMTSRLDTLLKKFGLEDRWKNIVEEQDYLKCDFSRIPEYMEKEQKMFRDYLSNVMK